jgi:hypothetical protein
MNYDNLDFETKRYLTRLNEDIQEEFQTNWIETKLLDYGIKIKRIWPLNGYKKLQSVIEQISRKWNKYSKDDQDEISKLFAGQRLGKNYEFKNLMDNKTKK